jgi:GTP-sensing pleiotropic transcriptional regulator CodY
MSALLEQIRQLNEILKKSAVETISFDELMKRLSEIFRQICTLQIQAGKFYPIRQAASMIVRSMTLH